MCINQPQFKKKRSQVSNFATPMFIRLREESHWWKHGNELYIQGQVEDDSSSSDMDLNGNSSDESGAKQN